MNNEKALLLLIIFTFIEASYASTKRLNQDRLGFFNKKKPLSILVVSPHPDDDIIACGGSIIKHVQAKNHVAIAYMTSGEKGSKQPKLASDLAKIREEEAIQASNDLGVTDLTFLHFPDGKVTKDQDAIVTMVTLIRSKKPDIIYAPHASDKHSDHKATAHIVIQAIVKAADATYKACSLEPHQIKKMLCYEVWTPLQQPTYTEDISDVIDKKLEALRVHTSQLLDKKYDDAIQGLNRYRSVMMGTGTYAECFNVVCYENAILI